MVKSLLFIWITAVVAFFVLWALLAWVVRRISEKRNGKTLNEAKQVETENGEQEMELSEEEKQQSAPESISSEG